LEEYAQQILALNRERPDLSLDEIVLALHKAGGNFELMSSTAGMDVAVR